MSRRGGPDDTSGDAAPIDMPPVASVMSALHRFRPDLGSARLAERLAAFGVTISASTIREMNRGVRGAEPRRDTLAALAAVFEVPVTVFFDWDSFEELQSRAISEASERTQLR